MVRARNVSVFYHEEFRVYFPDFMFSVRVKVEVEVRLYGRL